MPADISTGQWPGGGLKIACLQEEYADTGTLEGRLQDVARRMVSHQGGRRPEAGRPPVGPSLGQSNSFAGPAAAAGPSYGAGAGFGSGGQVNQLLSQPSRSLSQNGFLSDPASGLQQASVSGLGTANGGALAGTLGQNAGLLNRSAPSPQLSNGATMPVSSPAVPKPENGLGSLQMPSQFGMRTNGLQSASGLLQTPTLGPSGQPVMSNGAPVLLRGSRDWPSPGLMNVSQALSCKLYRSQTALSRLGR